jgi:TetR/AcrR family transcriptional regulator, cholesterol catabolism regulator
MLSVASVLFWQKGYQGTTMREIAKAYGCKPANIYNFFPNKEAILYNMLLDQMKRLISLVQPLAHDPKARPVEQLRALILEHLTHTLNYKKSYKLLFDVGLDNLSPAKKRDIVQLRDEYDRIVQGILERGIASGEFRRIDTKLCSFAIASMITRTILWYSPNGPLSVNEIADFILNFAVYGLKPEGVKKRRSKNPKVF